MVKKEKNIKPWYHLTEVGVIPMGWEIKKIKEVSKLINWRGFKPFEWKTQGLPIIRIQNLNGSKEFNYYEGTYDKKLEIENGQLLFAWSGSRGTSFGPHTWKWEMGLLNYHTWKVIIDESKISKEFYTHALKKLTKYIEDRAHWASALVHTQKWEMEGFEFPFPSSKIEQSAIAQVLSDTDALIVSLDALIKKKKAIKQGIMQELLTGKRRLPGFNGEWKTHILWSIVEIKTGKKDVNEWNNKWKYPFFTCSREHTYSDSYSFDWKAILIAWNGEVWNLHYYDWKFEAYQRTYVLQNFWIDIRYLWHQLDSNFKKSLGIWTIGSSIPYIKMENITWFSFNAPADPIEQMAIAQFLSDTDSEISELEKKRDKYKQIKQGMMSELLTGNIRLLWVK